MIVLHSPVSGVVRQALLGSGLSGESRTSLVNSLTLINLALRDQERSIFQDWRDFFASKHVQRQLGVEKYPKGFIGCVVSEYRPTT